jgi:hypothetical protein
MKSKSTNMAEMRCTLEEGQKSMYKIFAISEGKGPLEKSRHRNINIKLVL